MGVRDDDGAARRWATLSFLLALVGCTWAIVAALGIEGCESTTFFGDIVSDEACLQEQVASLVFAIALAGAGIVAQTVVSFRSGRHGAGITTVLSFAFLPMFVVGYIVFLATKPDRQPPRVTALAPGVPLALEPSPPARAGNGVPLEPSPPYWDMIPSDPSNPPFAAPAPEEWPLVVQSDARALAMQRRLARIKASHTDLDLAHANILLERFEGGDEASGARLDAVLAGMEDGLQFRRQAAPSVTYHDARTVAGDLVLGGKADVRDSVVTGNVATGQDHRCGTCGATLLGSAKFCPDCGAAQPSAGRL